MSDMAIRVEGLGKRYTLGVANDRYTTLRDQISRWTSPLAWARRAEVKARRPPFWALRDVSFEVEPGEVVGIIGRNGAGKSTLLKILSRITEPTEGAADILGRVGSLLEVGTGFHPELTGRENVYLNGAILGMRHGEIARKFDEIIAFAEVEKFVETPVKHYSSGMYMRLAFAVAAHLDPEILVVDEVLAVGDSEFQKKCLGKMSDVAHGGRTVLFVSHNMQTISLLCSKVIVLKDGRVDYHGSTPAGIARYYGEMAVTRGTSADRRPGLGDARFLEVTPARRQFRPDEPKRFRFRARACKSDLRRCDLSAHLVDETDRVICQCDSRFLGVSAEFVDGMADGELVISHPWLKPGDYAVHLYLIDGRTGVLDLFEHACRFQVLPILPYGFSAPESSIRFGGVLGDFSWVVGPDNQAEPPG